MKFSLGFLRPLPLTGKKIVIRNAIYNIGGYVCRIVIGLLLTPYLIRSLGPERFGIWAIAGVVTGYLGLFDFGFGLGFVKYLSEFYAKSEVERMSRLVSTAFVIYALFTVVIGLLLFVFQDSITRFFKVPERLESETELTLFVALLVFGINASLNGFISIQTAMQRLDIANKISVAVALVNAAAAVFVLRAGYGLPGLVLSTGCVNLLAQIFQVPVAYRLLPGLRFKPLLFDSKIFGQLFHFGFTLQIARVSGWISSQIDKVFIGALLSLSLVASYELGNVVVGYVTGVSALLVSTLLPAFSAIKVRETQEQLIKVYRTCLHYGVCFILPLFIFIGLSGTPIMKTWMGEEYASVGLLITLLSGAFLINSITQISASLCLAIDRTDFFFKGSMVIILLNTGLSYILIQKFGFWGAAWGTFLAVNIGALYFIAMLHQELRIGMKEFLVSLGHFAGASALSIAALLIFDYFVPASHSLKGWFILAVRAALFWGIYVMIVWKGNLMKLKVSGREN